ncbi:MAG: pentapeptide repeat-containing protein [Oscillospiraceae bacterium]|jgi:hypothetical protein|nr:pentapeptide repeat-containing protein [Oscillospiraceae bacterium]
MPAPIRKHETLNSSFLKGQTLHKCTLQGCKLSHCELLNCRLQNCILEDCLIAAYGKLRCERCTIIHCTTVSGSRSSVKRCLRRITEAQAVPEITWTKTE